ncbi:MAG TPA: YihY/virulence factor BrkB family protein [Acidobacteriaceae bacterium]|jgi:membrane protein|nr:YihY/virulence factor BrkB family protein [Acidobacteriaceae bacterium]
MLRLFHHLRRAIWSAFSHGVFSMAKAAAYSAILSIFPALLVVTTVFAMMPAGGDVRGLLRAGFERILPPDTMQLVQMYFVINHARSVRIVWGSAFITIFAAMGVLLSLMEGFRRAYRLPRGVWGFWRERVVALLLVPGTMVPMATATVFLAFGHAIERWMIENSGHDLHNYVIVGWRLVRWVIAALASVLSLMVVYHFGVPREELPAGRERWTERRAQWRETLPGAAIATATWFLSTLLYGWYVIRFGHYSLVYGSLGAGIATLVWLYMVSLSVLMGAEINAQVFPRPERMRKPSLPGETVGPDEFTVLESGAALVPPRAV